MRRALALLLLIGCTPSFDSASDVRDLRVLAIQAEPPEAQYDASSADAVHIRILAVDPLRTQNLGLMKWDICAPTDSRRCDYGPIVPQASGSQTRTMSQEFTADIAVPASIISQLVGNDALGGFLSTFRAQFSLSLDDGDPNGPIFAEKALVYSRRDHVPNHNPGLVDLKVTRDGNAQPLVYVNGKLRLELNVEYGLRPVLADGAQEEYDTTDLKGNTVHLTEQASYAFFTTPGAEFDRDNADEPFDGIAPVDGLTRLRAFSNSGGTVWIIVRDGRGGTSWMAIPWETAISP